MREGWGLVALLGVWGWVGSCVGLIMHGFAPGGRFPGRAALKWGGAFILFFALWIAGMSHA